MHFARLVSRKKSLGMNRISSLYACQYMYKLWLYSHFNTTGRCPDLLLATQRFIYHQVCCKWSLLSTFHIDKKETIHMQDSLSFLTWYLCTCTLYTKYSCVHILCTVPYFFEHFLWVLLISVCIFYACMHITLLTVSARMDMKSIVIVLN